MGWQCFRLTDGCAPLGVGAGERVKALRIGAGCRKWFVAGGFFGRGAGFS